MLPLPLFPKFLRMLRSGDMVYDGNGNKVSSYLAKLVLIVLWLKDILTELNFWVGNLVRQD
ncbi:hypothetical protein J4230_01340 [Candidatus Woesearchaeota archaeon]|nr:hypothetical protein [Candidatus Woesearchaeota archaeon]